MRYVNSAIGWFVAGYIVAAATACVVLALFFCRDEDPVADWEDEYDEYDNDPRDMSAEEFDHWMHGPFDQDAE